MKIKVAETNKIYSVGLAGWKNNQWSEDMADEVLVDMWWLDHKKEDFSEGYTLTQKEFDEFQEWAKEEEKKYNNGKSLEWFERSEEHPECDYEEIRIDVSFEEED